MGEINITSGRNISDVIISLQVNSKSEAQADNDGMAIYLYNISKRIFDIFISVLAIFILSPLITAVCFVLLVSQGSPILVSHRRVGRHGRSFPCLKFRTMVVNAEEVLARHLALNPGARSEWEETRKLEFDPRVTALGRSLRRSGVDEIPQLLNVIRGEMSLVGPKPITVFETEAYGPHLAAYISVRPGLTGLAQINGDSDASRAMRVEFDASYVENRSFWLDLMIIGRAFFAITISRDGR